MNSLLSKKNPANSNCRVETTEEEEEEGQQQVVSSQLYLKPTDKEVVLRRIRHRKRVNKVKSAVQTLFSSPFASDNKTGSVTQIRWADDAFAAP